MQLFLATAAAVARNDPPPSSDRPWTPPDLPRYEGELAGTNRTQTEGNSKISIDPRKVYKLAELIDIAQRNNPETRYQFAQLGSAWQHASQPAQ
jgi:hypothetical protein